MNNELEKKSLRDEIDWIATLVPLFGVLFLGLLFLIFPDSTYFEEECFIVLE